MRVDPVHILTVAAADCWRSISSNVRACPVGRGGNFMDFPWLAAPAAANTSLVKNLEKNVESRI